VVDGDTVILKMNNNEKRIRLVGINTPEAKNINGRKKECFGKEASDKAKKLLNNQIVYFELNKDDYYDQYGRLLGYIFLKNPNGHYQINFAKKMIEDGFGYEYTYRGRRYEYQKEFREAERLARNIKFGV
jgi:micrococcal nuclease